MENEKRPLKLAYIIFLVISIIYYVIALRYDLNYETWERLIVATTISSYCFSLNSINKTFRDYNIECMNAAYQRKDLLKRQIRLLSIFDSTEKEIESAKRILNSNEEFIDLTVGLVKKYKKKVFFTDVIGFLVFFCVYTFEPLYNWFSSTQELYTMIAFIAVLAADYIEPIVTEKTRKSNEALVDVIDKENEQIENLLSKIQLITTNPQEEISNGQT